MLRYNWWSKIIKQIDSELLKKKKNCSASIPTSVKYWYYVVFTSKYYSERTKITTALLKMYLDITFFKNKNKKVLDEM